MKQKYTVLRQHFGDRLYVAGEVREAEPASVQHLVGSVLAEVKAAPVVENKAAPKPANKAMRGRKRK